MIRKATAAVYLAAVLFFTIRVVGYADFDRLTVLLPSVTTMILESAVLDVKPGLTREFEAAFRQAQSIISASKGYLSHELRRCVEKPNRYLLLVRWETLEDHTEGFRKSAPYQEWRRLLHHFYEPFPVVEHYEAAL